MRQLGWYYRNLPQNDFGVDGLIETAEDGRPTGRLLGVQIKAGGSRFARRASGGWYFYVRAETVAYWQQYAVPVILTLADVVSERAYWALARREDLHSTKGGQYRFFVPEAQPLDASAREALAALAASDPALLARYRALTEELSRSVESALEAHRADWREGSRAPARRWLASFRDSPAQLASVSPAVAASVMRFWASTILDEDGDLEEAKRLTDDAAQLDPSADESRLRAMFLVEAGNEPEALTVLEAAASPGAQILRAGLLLRAGDDAGAAHALDSMAFTSPVDLADYWRLRALLHVRARDMDAAREALREAERHGPRYLLVRRLRASLAYLESIPRAVLPPGMPAWPSPLPPACRRYDLDARRLAAEAAEFFREVLGADLTLGERREIETWRLAALVTADVLPGAAVAYAREILARDPAHPFVLLWAATEDFPLDLEPSLAALAAEVDHSRDASAALAYVASRASASTPSALASFLDGWRARFADAGLGPQWALWRARAALASGELEEARSHLPALDANLTPVLEAEILSEEARRSGDSSALLAYLHNAAASGDDPLFLLHYVEACARSEDWRTAHDAMPELLDVLPTAGVRRLAILAAYHADDRAATLRLLDAALQDRVEMSAVTDERELRRMRASVRLRSGDGSGAIADLEVLVASTPAPALADQLMLARALFFAGHSSDLVSCARRITRREDLDAESALMLCEVVVHDAPELARELWRIASARGIPEAAVVKALTLGYRLDLDRDLRDLTRRMEALAASGNEDVIAFSLEELLAAGEDWRSTRDRLLDQYRRGEIPTHVVAGGLNEPLVRFYRVLPTLREAGIPQGAPALQFRDGSLGLPGGPLPARGRAALDVSSLLLAAHLDVLGDLERALAPIRLSHFALVVLREQRDALTPHQPSRVTISRRLVDAASRGTIETWRGALPALSPQEREAARQWWNWVALLERARAEDAFVLDLPLTSGSLHERPADVAGPARVARLVTVDDVRRVLDQGAATSHEDARAGAVMDGHEPTQHAIIGATAARPAFAVGAVLYCTSAGAEALAGAEHPSGGTLLAGGAEAFRVRVDASDLEQHHAHIAAVDASAAHARWIDRLIERVSDGLLGGTYALLPVPDDVRPAPEGADDDGVSPRTRSLAVQSLVDLFRVRTGEVDAVCVDDRWVSRHPMVGAARLTNLVTVLAGLEAVGALPSARLYDALRTLRTADVRLIPIAAGEIGFHLSRASVAGGILTESAGLRTLREATARSLADATSLRIPSDEQLATGAVGDLEIVRGLVSAVRDSVVGAWERARADGSPAAFARAAAESDWVAENLYLDMGLLRAHVVHRTHGPDVGLSAIGAALYLSSTLQLLSTNEARRASPDDRTARAFASWVYERLVLPRAEHAPDFLNDVVVRLRTTLVDWAGAEPQEAETPQARIVRLFLAARTFQALPSVLQKRLAEDPAFVAALKLETTSSLAVGPRHFATRPFLEAVALALASRPRPPQGRATRRRRARVAQISTIDTDATETFELRALETPDHFELLTAAGVAEARVRDTLFPVLSPNAAERRAAYERGRIQADASRAEWAQLVESAELLPEAMRRFELLSAARERSVDARYSALLARWRAERRVALDDFDPPPASDVLRHLRLAVRIDVGLSGAPRVSDDAWEQAAETLLADEGLETAFVRLGALPRPLPGAVTARLRELDDGQRDAFVRHLLREPAGPCRTGHVLRVLGIFAEAGRHFQRLRRRLTRRLATPAFQAEAALIGSVAGRAWHLLRVAERESTSTTGASDDTRAAERLLTAWYHAERIVAAARQAGVDTGGLADWLAQRTATLAQSAGRLFATPTADATDVSHPDAFSAARLTMSLLQYVTGAADDDTPLPVPVTAVLITTTDTGTIPHLDLLRDFRRHSNILDTWLQPTRGADGTVAVQSNVVVPTAYSPEHLLEMALAALEQGAPEDSTWLMIEAVTGAHPLHGAAAHRFAAVARRTDVAAVLDHERSAGQLAVARLAREAVASSDGAWRADLRSALLTAARDSAREDGPADVRGGAPGVGHAAPSDTNRGATNAGFGDGGGDGREDERRESSELTRLGNGLREPGSLTPRQLAVVAGLYVLAAGEPTPAASAAAFAADLEALATADRAYLLLARHTLERLVRETPLAEAHHWMPLLLAARST